MIWHIFKKDCRLLWPFAVIVALVQAANALVWVDLGHFLEPTELRLLADLLPMIALLSLALLVAVAIHQDAIPGTSQDWLVRPINRGQLLLAKLLFVVAVAHGPLFFVDVIEGLANGMPLASCIGAAWSMEVSKLCLISLPAFVLATVTRSLTEFFIAGFVLLVICVQFIVFARMYGNLPPPVAGGGLNWLQPMMFGILILLIAAMVLPRQYLKRATFASRGLIVAGVVMIMIGNFLPWQAGFAIQKWFANQPGIAKSVELRFEPSIGDLQEPAGSLSSGNSSQSSAVAVFLPLRVTGLAADSVLLLDRAEIRLTASDGAALYKGATHLSLDGYARVSDARFVARQKQDANAVVDLNQTIFIPSKIYASLKDQRVLAEIDYSLSLLQSDGVNAIAALDGDMRTANATWCKTRVDGDGDEIQLACLMPGRSPSCASVSLQHEPSGASNPELQACMPDYSPFEFGLRPTLLSRRSASIPFLDKSGASHYAIDGLKLAEAKLIIDTYDAQDHFDRHLAIPDFRLSDWESKRRIAIASSATTTNRTSESR